MTKGRNCIPSSADEGNWFRHRGGAGQGEGHYRTMTSTRAMLAGPFSAPAGPRTPPEPYTAKEKDLYQNNYPFTQHDNRHYFQDHGVYFGDGKETRRLGRRLHSMDQRLHHTDKTHLHHRSLNAPTPLYDYNPTTATSYRAPGPTGQTAFRRFPRVYKTQEDSQLSTNTTRWASDDYNTPLKILSSTQEPFLSHNTWKYSHHGLTKVYPSYNRRKMPAVPNVLNRYGPNFASAPVASAMPSIAHE